jgi:hypothetical protein
LPSTMEATLSATVCTLISGWRSYVATWQREDMSISYEVD